MAITKYKSKTETLYRVSVETRSIFTGKRKTKQQKGIKTRGEANLLEKEFWMYCRHYKPNGVSDIKTWIDLKKRYLDFIDENTRSDKNPEGFSESTVRSKFSKLKQTNLWNNFHLDVVTPQVVRSHLDEREKNGASRHSTNTLLKEIKAVFKYAVELGVKDHNPFENFKMRKMIHRQKDALTHEEVRKLLFEARKNNHPFYHIWLLSISLGLRRSELAGLKWTDIDWQKGIISIQRQLIPREGMVDSLKSGRGRVVAIPSTIIAELKTLKLSSTDEFVVNPDNHAWRSGHQAKVLRDFCRKIGIKEISHHALRATHITLALVDGIPLGIVKENVGHSKLSTTDVYFRSSGIQMSGQMDELRVPVPTLKEGKVFKICGNSSNQTDSKE